ncbi:hypothetical protein D5086_028680, partial [Populus alba]
ITIEVQGKSFTLKQIIDATRKFSPKMEIGRGRFGIVYKAELPNEIKLAVKKISPQSKQHGKDELQREIFNMKSLHHENLAGVLHDKGRILDLVDKKLASSYNRKQALTVLLLAMKIAKTGFRAGRTDADSASANFLFLAGFSPSTSKVCLSKIRRSR